MLSRPTRLQGFTLVELSIVLVILGLLVGGVLAGQSLIRASELRAATTEFTQYKTALNSFREKYMAQPGDLTNASAFWSGVGNGNGNSQINNTVAAATNEISLFWIHLSNAGLVEGNFTNVGTGAMNAGINNPASKLSRGAWNIIGLGTVGNNGVPSYTNAMQPHVATYYAGEYGNALLLGLGNEPTAPGGLLKSEEAWNIDTKIDDGRPDKGSLLTSERQGSATSGAGCGNRNTSTSAIAASDYDLSNTSNSACSLVFKTGS